MQQKKKWDKKCIINNLFIGYYETEYKCPNGGFIYSFESTSFILFDLINIYNYYGHDQLSIEKCFKYFIRNQKKNSFYCNKCGSIQTGSSKEIIYQPPKILVIILDRGKGKVFRGKVEFDITLDLKEYIDKENNNYNSNYELIGVIIHSGESSSSGHYTACCLTDNHKYYYFSDDYKKEINENYLNNNEPYLLFYQKIKHNN